MYANDPLRRSEDSRLQILKTKVLLKYSAEWSCAPHGTGRAVQNSHGEGSYRIYYYISFPVEAMLEATHPHHRYR